MIQVFDKKGSNIDIVMLKLIIIKNCLAFSKIIHIGLVKKLKLLSKILVMRLIFLKVICFLTIYLYVFGKSKDNFFNDGISFDNLAYNNINVGSFLIKLLGSPSYDIDFEKPRNKI